MKTQTSFKILVVGGTPEHRGGVEQFCDRAVQALRDLTGHAVEYAPSYGAFLRPRSLSAFIRGLLRLVSRRRVSWDCVWLQYVSFPDLLVLGLCRILGMPVLVTPHLGSNWASLSNPITRWIGQRILATASGIALISGSQAGELVLPDRPPKYMLTTFIPRVFPPRCCVTEPIDRPLRLVHAGRLSRGKGSFLFIDVCAALTRAGLPFEASIIGPCDAAIRTQLHTAIDLNNLDGCVTLGDALPERELLSRLASADVLVHLSIIDSFPLIVLESIACGVFPICKNLPGARLMVESYCGLIVDGEDTPDKVAEFLSKTTGSNLRAKASAASGRLRADFDWAICVAAVERVVVEMHTKRAMTT